MRYVFSPASKITVLPSVMASFGLTEAKSYEAPSKTSVPTAVMVLPPFFTSITSAVEMSVVMVSFSMSVSCSVLKNSVFAFKRSYAAWLESEAANAECAEAAELTSRAMALRKWLSSM